MLAMRKCVDIGEKEKNTFNKMTKIPWKTF